MVEENLYAKGLPAIQIVPATLAVAEERDASGEDALLALILGYEVSGRISRATKTKLAIHPSGTFGTIGAAVAAGKLARLDRDAMLNLINMSATLGLATSRRAIIEGATVGRAYSGASGYMGVLALDLAECGFTGESDGVGSVYGNVYSDSEAVVSRIPQTSRVPFDPQIATNGLGSDFLITKGFIKMHACARSIHPALDLIEELMARSPGGRIAPGTVERIEFRAYISPTTLAAKDPISAFATRFSLPFAVASLLYHGRGQLTNFSEEAYANPVIRELARKVEISENPEYTKFFPHKQPCDVKMTLRDGTVLEAHADYTRGDPTNPRKPEEFRAKFMEVASLVWTESAAARMLDEVMAFEKISYVRAFMAAQPF